MSLSKPNSWRTDTFMLGRPATSCCTTAAVIDPPWSRGNDRDPVRSMDGWIRRNLAESWCAAKDAEPNGKAQHFQPVAELADGGQRENQAVILSAPAGEKETARVPASRTAQPRARIFSKTAAPSMPLRW